MEEETISMYVPKVKFHSLSVRVRSVISTTYIYIYVRCSFLAYFHKT